MVAERRDYLERPYVCVVEAKKDDFEQGLAQCLVEMYTCQWKNANSDLKIDSLDVVTNAIT
ncbi:MAG: hypothetical protein ACFCA4_02215 [Cyanophyceae cyanobacterium]